MAHRQQSPCKRAGLLLAVRAIPAMVTIVETKSRCRSRPHPATRILFQPRSEKPECRRQLSRRKEAVIPIDSSQLRSAYPHTRRPAGRRASRPPARDTALAACRACARPATAYGLRRRPDYPMTLTTTRFAELNLDHAMLDAVEHLGYDEPTPIQEQAIPQSSPAATSSAAPRPAPARRRPSCCRSCSASASGRGRARPRRHPHARALRPDRRGRPRLRQAHAASTSWPSTAACPTSRRSRRCAAASTS